MVRNLVQTMLLGGALACAVAAPQPGLAQPYPAKPVRLVVPFAPGGSTDFVGRLFAEHLGRRFGGTTILVENKPGAATNIGLEQVARSEPDGYTLLMTTSQSIINMAFGPVPAANPFEALAPIGLIADAPFVLAANAEGAPASVKEVVDRSRAKPLSIGHAQFEPQIRLLAVATGAALDSIPFKGGAPSVTAALGGQVNLVGSYLPVVLGPVKSGKLRAIAVASPARVSTLPDVPTFAEQGFPRFTTSMWVGIYAPRGVPEAVLQRLEAASLAVAKDAAFAKSLQASGTELLAGGPPDLVATMRRELQLWTDIAKAK